MGKYLIDRCRAWAIRSKMREDVSLWMTMRQLPALVRQIPAVCGTALPAALLSVLWSLCSPLCLCSSVTWRMWIVCARGNEQTLQGRQLCATSAQVQVLEGCYIWTWMDMLLNLRLWSHLICRLAVDDCWVEWKNPQPFIMASTTIMME